MWTQQSTDDARRELVTWVATIGAALASVPVAAMVIELYHLHGYHRVLSPALLPIVTTALFARLFVSWVMRASSSAIVVLIAPLLGLANAALMAGLFSAFEQGNVGAMFGAMVLATMIGFPVSLSVGLAFGLAMWPLLATERRLRGRDDLDAGLALDGFAAGWALCVAAVTLALEAHAPLALYPGGPALVGEVAFVVAAAFAVVVAFRYARLGRGLQRMARGDDAEHRLVHAKGSLTERFGGAELVVVRVARTGEGPFRDGELLEPVAGVMSVRTLAERIAMLAFVAAASTAFIVSTRPGAEEPLATTQETTVDSLSHLD